MTRNNLLTIAAAFSLTVGIGYGLCALGTIFGGLLGLMTSQEKP